jgi:hypothetical protein
MILQKAPLIVGRWHLCKNRISRKSKFKEEQQSSQRCDYYLRDITLRGICCTFDIKLGNLWSFDNQELKATKKNPIEMSGEHIQAKREP